MLFSKKLKNLLFNEWTVLLFIVAICISLATGAYFLTRYINFKFSYESQVEKKICEMVKPEYLVKPCK